MSNKKLPMKQPKSPVLDTATAHPGGRPKDEAAAPALLAAARTLVGKHGYANVSVQMIATEAGVGRQTLYRRWPSKADLVLDAYLERAGQVAPVTDGPVMELLEMFLKQLFAGLRHDGPAISSLIATAQEDPDFRQTFYRNFIRPRDQVIIDILQRAVERGELNTTFKPALAAEMIHGAFWYRLLLGLELDDQYAIEIASAVLRSYTA